MACRILFVQHVTRWSDPSAHSPNALSTHGLASGPNKFQMGMEQDIHVAIGNADMPSKSLGNILELHGKLKQGWLKNDVEIG